MTDEQLREARAEAQRVDAERRLRKEQRERVRHASMHVPLRLCLSFVCSVRMCMEALLLSVC
jgi:hypothetical protein